MLAVLIAATTAASAAAESASISASVQVAAVVVSAQLTVSSGSIRVGDTAKAVATVSNGGTARAVEVSVTLRVDAAGLGVRGANPAMITQVHPDRSRSVSWTVCALQAGNYLLLARVTVDGVSVDSPAVLLSVTGQRKKAC
jgi:hypothetical protein